MFFLERVDQVSIIGRVAAFCPVCRGLRPFTLRVTRRVTVQLHTFYMVGFVHEGPSTPMGHDRVCEECNLDLPASLMDFTSVQSDPNLGLQDLIRETNPELPAKAAARLDFEQRIRDGALEEAQRGDLLREPFRLLDAGWRVRHPSKWRLLPLAGGLIVASILGLWGSDLVLSPELAMAMMPILGVTLIFSVIWLGILGFKSLSRRSSITRHLRLEIEPLLGRALKPLNPTVGELDQVREGLVRDGLALAPFLNSHRIHAEMNATPRP